MAQAYAGKKLRGKAEGKEQDALSRRIGAEQGMKSQEAAREQAAKAAELQARIEAFRANDPALDAVHGFNRPKPEQYSPTGKSASSQTAARNGSTLTAASGHSRSKARRRVVGRTVTPSPALKAQGLAITRR